MVRAGGSLYVIWPQDFNAEFVGYLYDLHRPSSPLIILDSQLL